MDIKGVLNIAHRGARSLTPENTILAAQKGLDLGADLWELDVAMSSDGEMIILHDETLLRTSNAREVFPGRAPWNVHEFSLDELYRLEARDVLPECLRSLSRSDYPNVEVCVTDNASTDGSPEWAEHEMPSVSVLRNGRNLGWSGGNNAGIRRALSRGAEYVWILNNDVEVEPDCISRMVRYAEAHPETGVLGPLIYYFEPRIACGSRVGGSIWSVSKPFTASASRSSRLCRTLTASSPVVPCWSAARSSIGSA